MDCQLILITPGEINRFQCELCGRVKESRQTDPKRIHRECAVQGPVKTPEEVFIEALPEATRKRMGDRAKEFFEWFGIPPCGGCKERQKWLNEIDKKLFG